MPGQIPLHLGFDASHAAGDFVVTASNEAAYTLLQSDKHPVLLLLGPKGSGKTHLSHIWQHAHQAGTLDFLGMQPAELSATSAWLWEDADVGVWNDETQRKAFHLLNHAKEQRIRLLITASLPPASWALSLPDLRSRLLALPVATLLPPDDALMEALLFKHFSDRQLKAPDDVVHYLMPRLTRDAGMIMEFMERLDRTALATKRAITVPLAREVLGEDNVSF